MAYPSFVHSPEEGLGSCGRLSAQHVYGYRRRGSRLCGGLDPHQRRRQLAPAPLTDGRVTVKSCAEAVKNSKT